jgi:hypothetical protein
VILNTPLFFHFTPFKTAFLTFFLKPLALLRNFPNASAGKCFLVSWCYVQKNTSPFPFFTSCPYFPNIINTSINSQHHAPICTNSLFYILAPTCFSSSLPSSGSFLYPSELLQIQIEYVDYPIMCGYVVI